MIKARDRKLETRVREEIKYFEPDGGMKMKIYDTTLRDGAQSSDVNFSMHDKVKIAKALDDYGVDYIELGWPGATADDTKVFEEIKKIKLKHAKIAAFGSTRRLTNTCSEDSNLNSILKSDAKVAAIFGKTWLLHVEKQLKGTGEQNLEAIKDSIQYLVKNGIEVFYDAEHFFDGFLDNKKYALETLKAAYEGGASTLVLCDTRGKTLTSESLEIIKQVQDYVAKNKMDVELGVHFHNDRGVAAANTQEAANLGLNHIHVTVNGFGERTGNADLCTVIPNLVLSFGKKLDVKLEDTKKLSELVYALAAARKNKRQPYVGDYVYNHKGGMHVDAVSKIGPHAYEHSPPELVGNSRNIEWSELAGRANILEFARSIGKEIDKKDPRAEKMLKEIEEMSKDGYDLSLPAERMLLFDKYFGSRKKYFEVLSWKVMTEMNEGAEYSECVMTGRANGSVHDVVSRIKDNGPVDAMFNALLKLVSEKYPNTKDIRLVNYKVRIAKDKGVESAVNVYIEYRSNGNAWTTEGVSTNILEASLKSIVKSFRYYLIAH
jgi:2-isopropylmalate synthase